ncbi:MAG: hypothetical protein ACI8W8_004706, partial [Rhodothermales bacterium]
WATIFDTARQEPIILADAGKTALVLTTMRDHEELEALRHEHLKAQVQEGFEELARGEYSTMSAKDIKAEGRRQLQQEQHA